MSQLVQYVSNQRHTVEIELPDLQLIRYGDPVFLAGSQQLFANWFCIAGRREDPDQQIFDLVRPGVGDLLWQRACGATGRLSGISPGRRYFRLGLEDDVATKETGRNRQIDHGCLYEKPNRNRRGNSSGRRRFAA